MDRFDDEADAGNEPSTPASGPRLNNFYFAQLEEIERFGLTTLYVDFGNLLDFTVNNETGVLATAIAEQYYRYFKTSRSLLTPGSCPF
jgi:MCM N-terminal domain